jgi:hypothetical protein
VLVAPVRPRHKSARIPARRDSPSAAFGASLQTPEGLTPKREHSFATPLIRQGWFRAPGTKAGARILRCHRSAT